MFQPSTAPPCHWQLLSQRDLEGYIMLRKSLNDDVGKSRKGERLESFLNRMTRIRHFVERGDGNDWKRSLVCGVLFLSNSIAVNIQQFRLLVGRCKSSINGSLQQLGYCALPQGREMSHEFLCRMPYFQKDNNELKKWTIRELAPQKERPVPEKVFIVPLPEVRIDPPKVDAESVRKMVKSNFPCPAKFRHKYASYIPEYVQP